MFQLLKIIMSLTQILNFFSFLSSRFSLTLLRRKKTEKTDCKREGINLGDTWYCTHPCETQQKAMICDVLYQLRTANQLSDQWLFIIKVKKKTQPTTVSF